MDEYPAIQAELEAAQIESEAKHRYDEMQPYQAVIASQYQQWHDLYAPFLGDQWPSDADFRPGKIHVTFNLVRPAIEVGARLESLLPRIAIPTVGMDDGTRNRAEATEQLILTWLEASEWETWLNTLCTVKRVYAKGVLKVFWNDKDKRGDVRVVENPANLRLGWGMSDFSELDWALYEYSISAFEAMRRFPELQINVPANSSQPIQIIRGSDHSDPLGQRILPSSPDAALQPRVRTMSQYEQRQVKVWDYWYKHQNGDVCNALLIEGKLAQGPTVRSELPEIPYIVVENIHEPGSPEGLSEIRDIADLQLEFNRLVSHALQHIADDVDPAWQYNGSDGASMPPGVVPKAGEIVDVGDGQVNLIPKAVNVPPIAEMLSELWDDFHRISGIPEIAFGNLPGADTSGRATAIQIEAVLNRLDARRKLLYKGLRQLIRFWIYMAIKKNPKIDAGTQQDPVTGEVTPVQIGIADVVKGMTRWNIVAPEITPRDSIENTQNVIQKINARLSSLRSGMDEIGVDSPEAEVQMIKDEQRDVYLSPQQAQAIVSIYPILQQLQMQQAQLQQQVAAATPPVGPSGLSAVAQSQVAQNGLQNQQYAAQPTYFQDQNVPQPATGAQSPPPGAGQGPAPATTTLIRGGKALNQLAFNSGGKQ